MVHHDVERKCNLLTRFIVENLRDYAEKVRENLPIYLNTAEKIRLKISRNSLTLTDRTIWHNKLERIPISLIRECVVDHLSPKICYFANETVTNRYQIIVVLCKSADDSYRLVNLLQHKVNTQGHYKAHSQWLQNGTFTAAEEKVTPKSKHRTIASVEIIGSPVQSKKFAWGLKESKPKSPWTPESRRRYNSEWDESFESSPTDHHNSYHDVYFKDSNKVSQPTINEHRPNRRHSLVEAKLLSTKSKQLDTLPDYPVFHPLDQLKEHSSMSPRQREETNLYENLEDQKIKGEQPSTHNLDQNDVVTNPDEVSRTYTEVPDCYNVIREEQVALMRRRNAADYYKRGRRVRDAMRSSVVQYDSDTEGAEMTEQLQHNSNGIARVVVGGNESVAPDKAVTAAVVTDDVKSGYIIQENISNESEDLDPQTCRESGDGATTTDPPLQKTDVVSRDIEKVDNTLDGIYDNVDALKPLENKSDYDMAEMADMPATVEELLKSCERALIGNSIDVEEKPKEAENTDDDEEYELVLTGLKQLTRGSTNPDEAKETRYPHQIIAAMSTSQISNVNSESEFSKIDPIDITPQSVSSKSELTSTPGKAAVANSPAAPTNSPSVQRRVKSKHRKTVEKDKSARPQSVSSGLHLIKSNNDLRRSARRKGQYKSIAEYEKMQGNAQTNKTVNNGEVDPVIVPTKTANVTSRKGHSAYKAAPTTAEKAALKSPKSHRKSRLMSPPTDHRVPSVTRAKTAQNSDRDFTQAQLRSNGKNYTSRMNIEKDSDMSARRASVISIASVPNHVILRRVSSNDVTNAERKASVDRKSRSFDRKSMLLSTHKSAEDGVSRNGLTLVGSRNSLISHGRSQNNLITDSRILHHSESNGHLSLGEPCATRTPVIDARKSRARSQSQSRQVPSKVSQLHWTPLPELKKKSVSKIQYVSLPNTPVMSNYRQQPVNMKPVNMNGSSWDQNPGFKRFFDSILTYGPNGSKHSGKEAMKPRMLPNQPDIVLESLTPDHSSRADDSDTDSSIRSSASAYWPPELKQRSNCDDFEETASWKFHNPIHKNNYPINV